MPDSHFINGKLGTARSVELVILGLFLLSVPALEAPKNILALLYLLTWAINRYREKSWGGAFDWWDAVVLVWITSGLVAAAFAGLPPANWQNAMDPLRYGLILLALKRSGYPAGILVSVLAVSIAATVATLLFGFWQLYVSQRLANLELHSVGHVNHSAIYVAISLTIAVSVALIYWRTVRPAMRVLLVAAVALQFAGVLISSSRGAIGAALLAMFILPILCWRRLSRAGLIGLALCAALAVAGVISNEAVIKKQKNLANADNVMSYRLQIWNVSVAAWREFPFAGVGPSNFSRITMDRIKAWHRDTDGPFDETRYFPISHAHSLFFNTLAERGTYGAVALVLFFVIWAVDLFRRRPHPRSPNSYWAVWGAGAGALVIDGIAGSVNTTLHHEHAILTAVCIGCWLSHPRLAEASLVSR